MPKRNARSDRAVRSLDWLNAVPRSGDAFAAACGATTRPVQFSSIAKDKPAIGADGGFEDESARRVTSHRFHDVREVFLDLAFRDAQHLGQLV